MSTKILQTIGILIALTSMALVILQITKSTRVKEVWHSLKTEPNHIIFSADMVAALPAPVERYFLHAIAIGTPLAQSVQIAMQGSFKLGHKWLPMRATEIISAKGFVWKARVGQKLFQFSGADYYANGTGRAQFSLWGLLPVANATSTDTTRSAIGRLGCELIWLPSALLPQQGITWKAVDDNAIETSLIIDGEPVNLTLIIDSDGRILNLSLLRWGNQTADGSYAYTSFGGEVQAEQKFGGFTIPSQMSVGWGFNSEHYLEFFRATIDQVEFS